MANHHFIGLLLPLLGLIVIAITPAHGWEINSYAFVNEDASLRIKGKTIHLHGIHIPETGRHCRTNIRPVVCGSRAALALEFKIQGFVRCEITDENADGSLIGRCRVGSSRFDSGTDLSAYLLERGWAVSLPEAPIQYQTLEKIAYRRGMGIWGFPVDNPVYKPE